MPEPKKVVAVLDDLMFTVKINEAAKRLGFQIVFVKTETDVYEQAKQHPSLIILDLNCTAVPMLQVAQKLKSDPAYKGISVIAYLSHVQVDLKQEAQNAGLDMVMARSAFSRKAPTVVSMLPSPILTSRMR